MKNVTLHELGQLTGTNYHVLKELLASVPFTPGPNRAHIYNSVEALGAIYTVSRPTTLEDMKLRNETLNASLKTIELAKKTKNFVPADFSFGLVETFIKYCAHRFETLRLRGVVTREWITECEEHWKELFHQFCADYELSLPAAAPAASQTPQDP